MIRTINDQEGFLRLAKKLGVSWQDAANAKRQARHIESRRQVFRRCLKALRPRYE